jgi:hypothetical protein
MKMKNLNSKKSLSKPDTLRANLEYIKVKGDVRYVFFIDEDETKVSFVCIQRQHKLQNYDMFLTHCGVKTAIQRLRKPTKSGIQQSLLFLMAILQRKKFLLMA